MTEKEKKIAAMTPMQLMERSIIKKFKKEIWRKYTSALNDYAMISEGDKIAIPLWGDVKSFLLLKETEEILRHGINNFTYVPIEVPPELRESQDGLDYVRRMARETGCNRIATSETFDDVIEAILENVLYEAKVETIMPQEDTFIRPLYLTRDRDIRHFAVYNERQESMEWDITLLPFTGDERARRRTRKKQVTELIEKLEKENKYVPMNLFRSVENVNLATLTGYTKKDTAISFLDHYDR